MLYIQKWKTHLLDITKKNKNRLQKKTSQSYQNLSEEEKEKKCQFGCERYKNLRGHEKERLFKFRK